MGFHADLAEDQEKGKDWSEVGGSWSTSSNPALYAVNTFDSGGFNAGRFTAPVKGYYMCAAQMRMDNIGSSYTPVMILQRTFLFSRLNALRCTAMAWIFIPACCFAIP